MNKSGRQNENNEAVRRLVNNITECNTEYLIIDDLQNLILVDVELGTTYTVDSEYNITECNTGDKSKKQNGYVYTELYLNINNEIKKVNYGTHSLIAMCAYTEQYDSLVNNNIVPVVNHKDNCPFNNNPSNLEWTTSSLNILHGRIVEAAVHAHSSEHSLVWLGYDLYKQQSNNKYDFNCLTLGISCQDIRAYEQYIIANNKYAKTLKQYWSLTEKEALLSLYNYDEFIKWWAKRNNINIKKLTQQTA